MKHTKYKVPTYVKGRLQAYDDAELGDLKNYSAFAGLTGPALVVATEMASDMMSGTIRTDLQLAKDLSIRVATIHEYRGNPMFTQALGTLAMGVVRGNVIGYVTLIEKAAEKDWRAAKFLLELVGWFIPKSQHLNVNVNTDQSQGVFESTEEAIYAFVKKVKAMGWSLERIAEIYNAD